MKMTTQNDTQNNLRLQQTVKFFETLLRASADGIVITDPAKNIVFVNDTFCTFFSRKRHDVLETNIFIWLEKLDHNSKEIWKGLENQINENGIAKDVEFSMKTGKGMRYYSVNSSLLEKIDIEETGLIISIWRDDTERKMAKEALQKANDELEMQVEERTAQLSNTNIALIESKQFIESIVNLSPDVLYIYDLIEQKNVYSNDGIQKILNYSVKEVQEMGDKLISILMHPDDFKIYLEETYPKYSKLKDKQFIIHEYRMKNKNGQWIWLDCKEIIYSRQQDGSPKQILGVAHDITQRKQAEVGLQTERNNLVRIFEAMIDGVYIVDKKYDIRYVNHVLKKDFGPSEGHKCYEYFHDRKQVCPWCKNKDVFAGKTVRWEWYSSKNDKTYDLIDTPLINPDGTIYKLEIFRDITQRKLAEEEIRKSEESLREAQRLAHIGSWQWTIATDTVKWSEELYHINGLDPNSSAPSFAIMSTYYTPQSWKKLNAVVAETLRSGGSYELDLDMVRPDGAIKHTYARGEADYDASGKIVGLHGTVLDITERKLAEELNLMLKHSIDVYYDGIYWMDSNNKFIYVNDVGCKVFGYSREELMNKTIYDINPNATEQGMKHVWEQLRSKGYFLVESVHRRKDGTEFPVEIVSTYVQFAGREYNCGFARDITERKRIQEERFQLLEREHEAHTEAEAARKLDSMKSMFLASTSHELRTPLNSIIGFSSLLLEGCSGQLNSDQKEQLEIVYSSGKHLLTLINEIIDISKIEAGNINLNISEFKLQQIVDEAISMLRVSLSEKKLDLKVNVQNIVMKSDRTRLLQCIANLLSNAIKYTENGRVEITGKIINNNVIITVIDTGIGINTADIPRIFGPFVRLQTPLTYKTSGTGLGLYTVKKIAKEFLRGDVEVKSEFGKGSTFKLRIPVELEAK